MGTYRYLVADTLTGRPLDELPLQVSSFSQELNGGGGELTAELPLGDLGPIDWRSVTVPYKTSLFIVRDDTQVVWGGVINARPKGDDDTKATIQAEPLEAFLNRRLIKTTLTYGAPTDVFTIVAGIIGNIQAQTGGNLGITVNASPALSGTLQTISFPSYARAKAGEEIGRLADLGPFDWWISHVRNIGTGYFAPVLHLRAPQANVDLEPILAEYPGNVTSYTWPETGAANSVTGMGKGDGASKLIYEAIDSAGKIAEGYPLVEDILSLGEEDSFNRLTTRTQADLVARLVDNVVPQVKLNGDAPGLEFGSFPLGIRCRLRATSLFHPAGANGEPGVDVVRRVTGWSVSPPADGGIEQVTLNLATAPGKVVPPLDDKAFQRWLRQLEQRIRSFETRR